MFNFDITIDLHGCVVEEALVMLEERCFVEHSRSIMIIHGRGDGALKSAVRDFVLQCSDIKDYDWGEDLNLPGTDGITIVYT
ncbi:MAG: Smr/MutS family protein [Victivallaceae bacterium]|nr:Smr/MutS family protein [Victivallaceae bacterium]